MWTTFTYVYIGTLIASYAELIIGLSLSVFALIGVEESARSNDALEELSKLIILHPKLADLYVFRAKLYAHMGRVRMQN